MSPLQIHENLGPHANLQRKKNVYHRGSNQSPCHTFLCSIHLCSIHFFVSFVILMLFRLFTNFGVFS